MSRQRWYEIVGAFVILSLAFTLAVGIANHHANQAVKKSNRIAETSYALCRAAAGARTFWMGVRKTTNELLEDPGLSPIERSSNEHYVEKLNKVIAAASGIAHSCDQGG